MEMMTSLTYFMVAFVTAISLIYGSWLKWTWKYLFLPHPPSIPWLGCALSVPKDPIEYTSFICKCAVQFNHLFCIWLGPVPVIMSSRVEYVRALLSSNSLLKKSSMYAFIEDWLSSGLLTSYGSKWKKRRRMITPTFHFGILMDFVNIFEEHAKKLCFKLQDIVDTGKSVDIQVFCGLASLDIICETSMGVKINAQDLYESEYVKAVDAMNFLVHRRLKSPWFWSDFLYKSTSSGKNYFKTLNILHNFTTDTINKSIVRRKQERTVCGQEQENKKKKVFLDMLLDLYSEGEIDVDGIREEVDTFMFAGHDTVSVSLSWTLYELGRHPDVQAKLYEELKNSDSDLPVVERVKSIKYLDNVLKEGLRLHPPVPIIARDIEEDIIIENKVIPKGVEMAIFVYDLHRNPLYWDDPYVFCPDRFAEKEVAKRNPFCYIPFSAGARNCVGQKFAMLEAKLFLYYLISMYEIKSVQDHSELQICMDGVLKSENGILLEFLSR